MSLDDLIEKGKAAIAANAAGGPAASSSSDFADQSIWLDESNPYPSAPFGAPGAKRYTASVADVRNSVLGMAADPTNPSYLTLAKNLYVKGALYDMRYASNVNSVIEANDRAMKMYLASPAAKTQSYAQWLAGGGTRGKGSGGDGSGGPFTNSTVQLTTPLDARTVVDNALNQYLGRDASPKERQQFWKQLNATEAATPQIDSGTTSKGGTSRVVTGGVSAAGAQTLAEDFAKSRDNYAETQASTTILDWMKESILGDPNERKV